MWESKCIVRFKSSNTSVMSNSITKHNMKWRMACYMQPFNNSMWQLTCATATSTERLRALSPKNWVIQGGNLDRLSCRLYRESAKITALHITGRPEFKLNRRLLQQIMASEKKRSRKKGGGVGIEGGCDIKRKEWRVQEDCRTVIWVLWKRIATFSTIPLEFTVRDTTQCKMVYAIKEEENYVWSIEKWYDARGLTHSPSCFEWLYQHTVQLAAEHRRSGSRYLVSEGEKMWQCKVVERLNNKLELQIFRDEGCKSLEKYFARSRKWCEIYQWTRSEHLIAAVRYRSIQRVEQ